MASAREKDLNAVWIERFSMVDRQEWDALAAPLSTPFLEWDWLNLMESSGSMTPRTGWLPFHLTVRSRGRLVGAAPLYVKTHSEGEFVFDYPWVEIAGRLGIPYYPKLVGMSPATPVSGYRFLIAPDADEEHVSGLMIDEIHRTAMRNRFSGCHFLYVDPEWRTKMLRFGFSEWVHPGFAWRNPGYRSFDDYLRPFHANQRRNIKREKKKLEELGIVIRPLTGDQIPGHFLNRMYRFYERTNEKFGLWGCKYLTKAFFDGMHRNFLHRLVVMAALKPNAPDEPLGMALLIRKSDRLYGRYWGCSEPIDYLHFNACYYAPIQWAIESGVHRFDPGIGGAHKLRRGFTAEPSYSLHRFHDPRMRQLMRSNIDRINRLEQQNIERLNRYSPMAKKEER